MRITKLNRPVRRIIVEECELPPAKDVDYTPPTPEEEAEIDRVMYEAACEANDEVKKKRIDEGFVVAATDPEWCPCLLWIHDLLEPLDRNEPVARSLALRLRILGGGDVSLRVETYLSQVNDDKPVELIDGIQIRSAESRGIVEQTYCEMESLIVAMKPAEQDFVDRVTKTLASIHTSEELPAFLVPATRCATCSRPLTDEISQVIQFGPTCAKKIGVPYTREFANQIIAKREELFD